ncbi:MAG: tetraacyldisaccharide 4'-kinase [Proteobacteria bacterium]|nr:tetraacyldisaccharide 4'-kinase [Pseudomonadota bacterium]
MFTPTHWKSINFTSILMWPLGCLYGLATALRIAFVHPQKVNAKVICVGNLTAGGTGKTPVAVALAKLLAKYGRTPFFITRGYGGKLQDIVVDAAKHSAREVGDEPLLLARQAPVVVNRRRYDGARKAVSLGADTIVMDDGFQNPSLYKDLSLLVIDGEFGLGNGFCIPAGPLREFVSCGLRRAQAVIIVGPDKHHLSQTFDCPVFHAAITPSCPQITNPRTIAFAGIGRPQKFYQSLRECGFEIIKTVDFPDHHFYREAELNELIGEARKNNADIYTTSKDYVKIPAHLRSCFKVLEIEITWQEPERLAKFILG